MEKQNDEFIDLTVNDCIVGFRQEYQNEYKIIEEFINIFRMCEEEMEKIGPNLQNTYLLAAIMQLNKLYQSTIILFERGLKDPANVIIRTIIELVFKSIAVIRDEEFIDKLSLYQQYENKKCLEDIKNNKLFDMVPEKELEILIKKCNKEINGAKKPDMNIYELAKQNKLSKEYILYRLQCDYTHHSNSVIEGIIKVKDNGYYIDGNFQLEDFKKSVAWVISITSSIFPILLNEYLKNRNLIGEYNKFLKKFEETFKDVLN